MKNIVKGLLVLGLLIGTPNALLAQGNPTTRQPTVTDEARTSDESFSTRLEEARQRFSSEVTKAKEERIAKACSKAQAKIVIATEKASNFQSRHSAIYEKWLSRLTSLSARIATAGVDTTVLDGYLQELNALIAQNTTDLENYIAGLKDVNAIDCVADAAGFYEALQAARATRSLVVDDTKGVVDFVNNNIRPELNRIKELLAKTRSQAQDGDSSSTTPLNQNSEGGTQ